MRPSSYIVTVLLTLTYGNPVPKKAPILPQEDIRGDSAFINEPGQAAKRFDSISASISQPDAMTKREGNSISVNDLASIALTGAGVQRDENEINDSDLA